MGKRSNWYTTSMIDSAAHFLMNPGWFSAPSVNSKKVRVVSVSYSDTHMWYLTKIAASLV